MFTTKFYVDVMRNNALMLRITNNRKKAEMSLGFQMTEETLANALSPKPRPENVRYHSMLTNWQLTMDDLRIDLAKDGRVDEDVKKIKDRIRSALFGGSTEEEKEAVNEVLFATYFRGFAERKSNRRTRDIYLATLSRMVAFEGRLAELRFEDITIRWLNDFDDFLAKTSPSRNARNIHFRNIRTVFNRAIDEELTASYPFRRFKIKPTPTRKRSMSCEQMRKIFNADGLEQWEVKYLDFFKLSFMLIGINVVDLCGLSEITEGRIDYIRAKTHRPYSVKVEPEAMEIIKKHRGEKRLLDFAENYANYRHFYNNLCKGLNSIKGKIGIKELTSYWARHTWATIAAELDIPDAVIGQALGHAETSVTSIYIRRNEQKVDEANRKVLDYVLYGKK